MLLKFPFGALCGHSDQTSGMAGPWQGSLLLLCAERAHKCTSHSISHRTMFTYVCTYACNTCLPQSVNTKEELFQHKKILRKVCQRAISEGSYVESKHGQNMTVYFKVHVSEVGI